jgi:hypothetical protein
MKNVNKKPEKGIDMVGTRFWLIACTLGILLSWGCAKNESPTHDADAMVEHDSFHHDALGDYGRVDTQDLSQADQSPDQPKGLALEKEGTEQVYFTHNGNPILSFGGASDFIFYLADDAFDYQRWANWAASQGMNHIRAYPPLSWRTVERKIKGNGGSVSNLVFPYKEISPRKFDLTQFNDIYWNRFRTQCEYLQTKRIIVHLLMVNGWEGDEGANWAGHFFNPKNTVNTCTEYLSEKPDKFYSSVADGKSELVDLQKAWFRKLIEVTHDLDNVYYDLVHEIAGHYESWDKTKDWVTEMAAAVRSKWSELQPDRPVLLGMDTGGLTGLFNPNSGSKGMPEKGSQMDWIFSQSFFDLLVYGKRHYVTNAIKWREEYKKPYIGQESWDDHGEKWTYRVPEQRVHLRKYIWKFMMAKCQQIDFYIKEQQTYGPSGYEYNYDPNKWNEFENDARHLRDFWNSLKNYETLWFKGEIAKGPGTHKYVLSSESECIAYCSSSTGKDDVAYEEQTMSLEDTALQDGEYVAKIFKPSLGPVNEQTVRASGREVEIPLPSFVDDIAVHLYKK